MPDAAELQDLIADAEVGLILQRQHIKSQLIETAWYLHAIASVNGARERYSLQRQRQAFLVSAHIFDLALSRTDLTSAQRLTFGFAAAIGYRRGGRDPNATAILVRLTDDIAPGSALVNHADTLSRKVGVAFLGFDTKTLFRWLGGWRRQLAKLAEDSEVDDLSGTSLELTQQVVLGAEDILTFLARGNLERFERGRARLAQVVAAEDSSDLNSRWVAAHLLNFADAAAAGSLWNPEVMPPEISSLVRQAFTVGSPPVLTLWEPQRDLLLGAISPFDPAVRRMVLAVPTSGGKTLVAQLLAVEHLARTEKSVCYVVPTRSLGREVRRAMAGRVRVLQKETASEVPDFPTLWDFITLPDSEQTPPDVEVMTPERLAHMLRHDAQAVFDRFGMFVFDEAQLLKEGGRGFVLESVIAALDYFTRDSDHIITLISAAMGNASGIAQWLGKESEPLLHQSEWRGPRRLHAVFNTRAMWETTEVEEGVGRVWPYRHTTELTGLIRLRMASGQTTSLSTTGDTGWRLVRKSKDGGQRPRETTGDPRSTKQYVIASEMIADLGHAGSILVVASTKVQAQALATGLADTREEVPTLAPLVDFVRQQLGGDHPLVATLRHGVGFHHAGLPVDVLEALEAAVREDILPFLTCTSTLTDGVNLPVRTVVLYDQAYPGQPEESRLRGARLVNAMGRAGRAGKETEGWIVLVRAAEPREQDFQDLNPDSDALTVTSSLLTDSALEECAHLEAAARSRADALFEATGASADFVSFVWLMCSIEEGRGRDPEDIDIDAILDSTLAALQSPEGRERYRGVARATHQKYLATPVDARRRWPRTGTSIGSARAIDALALALADMIHSRALEHVDEPLVAIDLLSEAVQHLLQLPEAKPWSFRASTNGAAIEVSPIELLRSWIAGDSLPDLAEAFLQDATNSSWRIEQMVSVVTEQFEHYLAWTVGALVELVNLHLEAADGEHRLCPELPGYIRYGVGTARALQIMTSGIRSRRIAGAVALDMPADLGNSLDSVRAWLAQKSIAYWRETYGASSSEVLDLIEFTRVRRRSLLKSLLENGSVELNVEGGGDTQPLGVLTLAPLPNEPTPAPLALFADHALVALVGPGDYADVQAILDTGFGIDLTVEVGTNGGLLVRITLPLND